jgi:hypothetical protein
LQAIEGASGAKALAHINHRDGAGQAPVA